VEWQRPPEPSIALDAAGSCEPPLIVLAHNLAGGRRSITKTVGRDRFTAVTGRVSQIGASQRPSLIDSQVNSRFGYRAWARLDLTILT
jgi:hypothetical protein